MARKYDFISELYNRTCKMVVANPESWEAFLRSACYNYRLRFDEQLLVHAQRPDATAVLQIDDWNQKFGRWVNRGAHGIAVFEDADQRRQRLVHYFDISDTHPSRFSRRVPIWQMRDEYTAEVIDTLESTFGELDDKETLAVAIESAARNAVEDNIPDYLTDLLYSVKDSFLDGVSEEEITHIFKTAVRNSVAYMTMTRLGIEAGEYFEPDDLRDVVNFTTPATLNALGYATSDIAEMGLAEISRTILALDRQNRIIAEKTKADYNVGKEKTERSPDDERDHLHEAGGLSAPRSDNAGATGAVDGQVRPDAEEVPEGASQGTLLQPADELRPKRASERHGAQSERAGTDADGADGSVGGRDGESESDGYDELGSEDEQYPEPGSGDRDGGGNLRLDYYDRSHEDKSLPFFGGDDTVREILGTTPHLKASKDEIRAFFEATADENARISYIKRIFNNDYTEVILSDGRRVGYKTYQNVLQLWEGSYLSRTAQSFYDWGVIAQHFEAMRLLGELQDTIKPLPSIDGQLSLMTAGAEERKPSAFTFSQEIIDAVLTRGSGISEGKMRIYEQFQKSLSAKENADFLKNEYGWGGAYPVIVGAGIDEQHDGSGIKLLKGFNDLQTKFPSLAIEWSDKNLPLTPDAVNEKSTKNVWWKCNTCGYEWKAVVKARVKGGMCPVCAERAVLQGYNDFGTTDPHLLSEWDYEKNAKWTPSNVSRNSMKVVWWKCGAGHSYRAKITDRTIEQKGCPQCEAEFQQALPQMLIMMYGAQNGITVKSNSDSELGMRLVAYLPELHCAVDIAGATVTEKREQSVKAHICQSNRLGYYLIKRTADASQMAAEIKTLFIRNHIYLHTDSEKDVQVLRERFLEWKYRNACKLNGKY